MGRLNPGRRAALKALIAVESGAHAEDELTRLSPRKGPDRGLAWHLCLGTLRVQGSIDRALAPHLRKPGSDVPDESALEADWVLRVD